MRSFWKFCFVLVVISSFFILEEGAMRWEFFLMLFFSLFLISFHRPAQNLVHTVDKDPLTGFSFSYSAPDIISKNSTNSENVLISVSIINLSAIRTIHGINESDAMIVNVVESIRSVFLDKANVVGIRYSGATFLIFIPDQGGNMAVNLISEFLEKNQTNNPLGRHVDFEFGMAIGNQATDSSELIEQCLSSKKKCRSGEVPKFYGEMHAQELIANLKAKSAVKNLTLEGAKDNISVVYQPQFDGFGHMAGVECLCRWSNKDTPMNTIEFIELAEELGTINIIGIHVLKTAISEIKSLQAHRGQTIPLSVNISPVQLLDDHFIETVVKLKDGMELTLELTESTCFSKNGKALESIDKLKSSGVKISLDDFGSGYSTFSVIDLIKFDEIKIDKTITNLPSIDSLKDIVSLLIKKAPLIVVEGIEEKFQSDAVRNMSANIIEQGYYHSRPLPLNKLTQFLNQKLKIN